MRQRGSFLSAAVGYAFLLMPLEAIASPVARNEAKAAANRFAQAIVSPGGFSYWQFEGAVRERMKPLLSKRLLASLDDIHSCVRDWARQQPPDSTDKPPGVDCCVFSASADWSPTSFQLQESNVLPDGRRRVTIQYRFDSPYEHARWHVAVYVAREEQRYVIDDFEGGLDPGDESWLVAQGMPQCKQGKWVSE